MMMIKSSGILRFSVSLFELEFRALSHKRLVDLIRQHLLQSLSQRGQLRDGIRDRMPYKAHLAIPGRPRPIYGDGIALVDDLRVIPHLLAVETPELGAIGALLLIQRVVLPRR